MIKNIIFDFGGVIYDIDHNLNKIAFEKLGVKDFDLLYSHHIQDHLFEDFETGNLSEAEFRRGFRKYLPKSISDQELDHAWCSLLKGVQREKIDLLQQLRENYQLYLLSNTTIIHYRHFIKELNLITDFRDLFHGIYFSHEMGMRKPNRRFYLKVLEDHRLMAQECLFIDDLEANILAAKELGFHTYYLHQESILDLFENGIWRL